MQLQPAQLRVLDALHEFGLALVQRRHLSGLLPRVKLRVGETRIKLALFLVPCRQALVDLLDLLHQRPTCKDAGLAIGAGLRTIGLACRLVGGLIRTGCRGRHRSASGGEPVAVIVEVAVEGLDAAVVHQQEAVAGGAQQGAVV